MAANHGGKLALRRSAGRHNTGSSLRVTQYSNKSTDRSHRDFESFSKTAVLNSAGGQPASSRSALQLAAGPVEDGLRPSYQPPSCMLRLDLPLHPLPCSKYLLCQQSVGDTTVGMAVGTSNVNDAEDQHREGPAHPEGARPQGQLPPLPSPSFPLCRKPISVWSEDYVWTLLTGDAQPCNQFGVNLGAGSSRMSTNVASSTEQSFEHVCQSRPTTSCSTMVTGEYTTTTTSSEPHVTRSFLCTAENMLSAPPSQRPPMLVPDTCALTTCSPHPAAFSSGTATTSGVCPPSHSSICTSSQSLSSPSVIDLTATEDDDGGPDDNDFDRLFADVDMAQFEESCLASQSTDSSETTVLKQDSKVQSLSSRRGQSCSVSNVQSGSRVEMYSDSGGGGVGSGRVALQTDAPSDSRSGKKAGISHRVEEKSSVSSCPVCAVAFQPSVTQKQADAHIRQCLDAMAIVLD